MLTAELIAGYQQDPNFANPQFTAKLEKSEEGLWRVAGTQVVAVPVGPVRESILALMHDAAWAGHMGVTKTLERVSRLFWWQTVRADVRHYVATCDSCQRNKSLRMKPAGLLKPLSIPGWRWESVSMDLVVKLTKSKSGFDSIVVFVDRLSKMVHLGACNESMTAMQFAKLFRDLVFRIHGMPSEFVSDRGTQFHSHFHDALTQLLGVRQCMSTSYHPQSDGQTEVYNGVMQEVLRHYVSPLSDDWDEHLACAEFAINDAWNETIQNTPFFVNFGQHPLTPVVAELRQGARVPSAQEFAEHWQSCVARARRFMQQAQERMKRREDKHRRDVKPYKPGPAQHSQPASQIWGKLAQDAASLCGSFQGERDGWLESKSHCSAH
jgi:hypothetical protein